MFRRKSAANVEGEICPYCEFVNQPNASTCSQCYYELNKSPRDQGEPVSTEISNSIFDELMSEEDDSWEDGEALDVVLALEGLSTGSLCAGDSMHERFLQQLAFHIERFPGVVLLMVTSDEAFERQLLLPEISRLLFFDKAVCICESGEKEREGVIDHSGSEITRLASKIETDNAAKEKIEKEEDAKSNGAKQRATLEGAAAEKAAEPEDEDAGKSAQKKKDD